MSGIAGIVQLDGRPVEPDVLHAMLDRLAHRGGDDHGIWVNGTVGLGAHLRRIAPESRDEVVPFLHSSGRVVVFDGRLDNRDECLAASRDRSLDSTSPDVAIVAALYD